MNIKDKFEKTGWSRINISREAQERIENTLIEMGVNVGIIDVLDYIKGFNEYLLYEEYNGDYKNYNGATEQCLLEKAFEHYLGFKLLDLKSGMTGIDIGSCQSVIPMLGRRLYDVKYYEQDLTYPLGVNELRIGSSADNIPLPSGTVDFMTLHCTFEHFENNADKGFIKECSRLLKNGGKVVVLPLYMSEKYCNVTGEDDVVNFADIGFDECASHYCFIPEWKNRFGRHYSPSALFDRVIKTASTLNLNIKLYKIANFDKIHKDLWLRWAMVITK